MNPTSPGSHPGSRSSTTPPPTGPAATGLPPFAPLLSAMPEPAPYRPGTPCPTCGHDPSPLTEPGRARDLAEAEITPERVIGRIGRRAGGDWRRCFDKNGALLRVHDIPDDVAGRIKEIEVEESRDVKGRLVGIVRRVKLTDPQKDDELLARHLKLLRDQPATIGVGDLVALIEEGRRRALQGQPLRLKAGEVEP